MEDSRKKQIMTIVIVTSLVTAGIITLRTFRSRGPDFDTFKGKMIWVKCDNPDCGAEYQVDQKWYFEYIEENRPTMLLEIPGLVCEKCNQKTAHRAVKCQQCGEVFSRSSVRGDFADRCPKCGYSEIENKRKESYRRKRTN